MEIRAEKIAAEEGHGYEQLSLLKKLTAKETIQRRQRGNNSGAVVHHRPIVFSMPIRSMDMNNTTNNVRSN